MTEFFEEKDSNAIQTAIDAGMAIASREIVATPDGGSIVFRPDGFSPHVIPPLNPNLPKYVIADERVTHLPSFISYINRFMMDTTIVFAKPQDGRMIARIDYHEASDVDNGERSAPNSNTHSVTFVTEFDESWKRWREIDRKEMSQVDFAYFVEEMLHTIAKPDGAELLDLAQNLKVHRNVVMKATKRLKDGTMDVEFVEKDETGTSDRGHVQLPDEITIVSPIYATEPATTVVAKLRYRLDKGEPLRFRVDILNRRVIELEAFQRMTEAVQQETGCAVYIS